MTVRKLQLNDAAQATERVLSISDTFDANPGHTRSEILAAIRGETDAGPDDNKARSRCGADLFMFSDIL